MYGGLDLAESIRLGTLGALKDSDHAPHIARRGIKFNVPLDVRTPSYSDSGDAAQQNIPEMWSFDFWRDFIDDMARHRYNVLSLWNLHPFPSLVKVPEYLDIALDDVKRTRVKIDDTFAPTGAHPRTIITNLSRPMAERPGMSRGPRVSTRRSRCPRSAGSAMAAFYSSGTTNTTPLPETEKDDPALPSGMLEGYREDVFTNRDTIHAAISSDEGHTWRGFRELYLDPRRAARDYGDTRGSDRGLHQNQFVEVQDGAVLVSAGQHWLHRSLLIFHPDWLLEKQRANRFENGLDDWCVHMYLKGIRGHCAYNREPGARLIAHPGLPGRKVLQICRPERAALVSENQGAIWNFPACSAGAFTARVMLLEGGQGGRISLLDRWVNPTDLNSDVYSMFNLSMRGEEAPSRKTKLTPGKWHEIRMEWNGLSIPQTGLCRVYIDGTLQTDSSRLNRSSLNGIGYVHFLSTAERTDDRGFLVEFVGAQGR